ncbi:MAG: archaemetzincin family Zn-dependent metalloprotease [Armatimonadetes bacterium]|nr:archaemetzincin family Zn-dependent metalloprotease [Armatimonadota bacterium]
MSKIYLTSVGKFKKKLLEKAALLLEERFLYEFKVVGAIPLPSQALDPSRNQYLVSKAIERLKKVMPKDAKFLLGITAVDLFVPKLNFVYGYSDFISKISLISTFRLNPEFYGETACEDRFFIRILGEIIHELGHLFGIKHCFNNKCAMYFSNSIYDLDNKNTFLCDECERKLKRASSNYSPSKLSEFPENNDFI